ncbi:MAG TPA: adenosine deaminase [Spirochaetota bacterium]|nr:adenosine deaminase [Spirochaetota bacterium]HPH02090.1 adenosine deaminase [Spirochaetota bacterium]
MHKNKPKGPSAEIIRALPKVELHRHLEGAFRLETLLDLARKRNLVDLPLDDVDAFRRVVQMTEHDLPDFLTFLSKFRADWYSTLEDPRRVAYEAVIDAAKENILYFEMRFSPEHYARKSGFALEAVIETVIAGAKQAADETGIMIAFLVTLGREKLDADEMKRYIKVCQPYLDHGVVGIDLAGDESHYPAELFSSVFKGLYERTGFKSTIHAGEALGPESVVTAVRDLDAHRIGHGVRTIEDQAAMDLILEKKIPLEMCLTSNLQTGTVSSLKKHPFPKFFKQGVRVTLNSDDPQIQQSDLNDDYGHAASLYQMTIEDFRTINRYSLEGAFQPDDVRHTLLARYEARFDAALLECGVSRETVP